LVIAFGIASLHRDRHFVARLHFARAQGSQRQNAFALEADVEEDRFTGNNDHSAYDLFAAVFALPRMAFFVLRKHVAE